MSCMALFMLGHDDLYGGVGFVDSSLSWSSEHLNLDGAHGRDVAMMAGTCG